MPSWVVLVDLFFTNWGCGYFPWVPTCIPLTHNSPSPQGNIVFLTFLSLEYNDLSILLDSELSWMEEVGISGGASFPCRA